MTEESFWVVIAILAVLAFDLLVIAARAGFVQITHVRLLAQRETMGERVNPTINLLSSLPRLRASFNAVLVLTRFGLAGLVLALLSLRPVTWPGLAAALGLFIGALLIFWFEWVTERTALRNPEATAIRMTGFARVLMAVFAIFTFPTGISSNGQSETDGSGAVTEDELKTLVDAGEEEGVFEKEERQMIYSIFELGNTLAREIMVPRIDMLSLDVTTPLADAVDAILEAGYSRVPVYEESVDNMLGLFYVKDALRVWRENNISATLRAMLRPAYFVPEGKKANDLLAEMQSQRIHMAIVVDEYGGVAGLVTLEDIVEEIFGEILDEYDQGEEAPYQKLADGSHIFLGRIGLDDFNEIMESNLTSSDTDTLGGYIYACLGHVPAVGEIIREGDLLLIVEQVSARRIRKVSARWYDPDEQKNEEQESADRKAA